jgi:hypothetical protein
MSTGQETDTQQGIVSDPSLNYGLAPTSDAQQFETEEAEAGAARHQGNPLAGFKLPSWAAGDFWSVYSMAEQFAANTGWKYLPTPQMVLNIISAGAQSNPQAVFQYFAGQMKVPASMPWASLGMNSQQYAQNSANLNDSLYSLTGQTSFSAAGLSGIESTALFNGWSSAHLQNYIQQNAGLNARYGYLALGQNFQQFQQWKTENASTLEQRYGTKYTDQNAIQELGDPLQGFHAQGGTFGESVPYVSAQSQLPTGRQSAVR